MTEVPPLRFPGFTEPWQRKKIGDDCDIYMCKRIFAHQTSEAGDVPFYKIGTIGNAPDAYISRELFDEYKSKYNYPNKGDVMITCAGTVGRAIEFDGKDSYFQDSNIVWLSNPKGNIDNSFLYYFLSQVDWSKLNSTTIMRIYNDDLRKLSISFPTLREQQKIAALLKSIDGRIQLQNKIIKRQHSLIGGIAQRLTAQSPNTRIADCLECHSSTLQESQVSEYGEYRVFGANGVSGFTNKPDIQGDSILIVKDGSGVGKVSFVGGEYSVIETSNYLTAKSGYSLRYLYYCLMCFNFVPYKTGMAIPHIYFKDYGKAKIYCPSLDKQNQKATALSKIESKIEIERSLLSLFTSQKQYLLQQMFI